MLRRRSRPRRGIATSRERLGRVVVALTGLVVIVLLALAVLLEVVPKVTGGMNLTVLTGSMEPGIKPGDIVVTRGIDEAGAQSLAVGDIITFLPYPDNPTLVTHRIVSLSKGPDGTTFVTRGDNNDAVDPWGPVAAYKVRGKVLYVVPKLGYGRAWAGESLRWVVPVVAGLLFVYAAVSAIGSFRRPSDDPRPTRQSAVGSRLVASSSGPWPRPRAGSPAVSSVVPPPRPPVAPWSSVGLRSGPPVGSAAGSWSPVVVSSVGPGLRPPVRSTAESWPSAVVSSVGPGPKLPVWSSVGASSPVVSSVGPASSPNVAWTVDPLSPPAVSTGWPDPAPEPLSHRIAAGRE